MLSAPTPSPPSPSPSPSPTLPSATAAFFTPLALPAPAPLCPSPCPCPCPYPWPCPAPSPSHLVRVERLSHRIPSVSHVLRRCAPTRHRQLARLAASHELQPAQRRLAAPVALERLVRAIPLRHRLLHQRRPQRPRLGAAPKARLPVSAAGDAIIHQDDGPIVVGLRVLRPQPHHEEPLRRVRRVHKDSRRDLHVPGDDVESAEEPLKVGGKRHARASAGGASEQARDTRTRTRPRGGWVAEQARGTSTRG